MSNSEHLLPWQWLGRCEYQCLFAAMQKFNDARTDTTPDQLWLCEHDPVFTLGLAASEQHLLSTGDIPVIKTDRGGQVTYHGPGQLMVYPLIDVRRSRLGVRQLVTALETCVIRWCQKHAIDATARRDAPGVYVDDEKLASIGLRIRKGASYHGLALNYDMDLQPFSRINPCGYSDLRMTDLRLLGVANLDISSLADEISQNLASELGRTAVVGDFEHPLTRS